MEKRSFQACAGSLTFGSTNARVCMMPGFRFIFPVWQFIDPKKHSPWLRAVPQGRSTAAEA